MTLISQPGSDYQVAEITLDAGHTRDVVCLLIDVHSVLDHLYLDGTHPGITAPAEEYLRYSGSPYTLPALIGALDDAITQITCAMRDAVLSISPPRCESGPLSLGPPASNPGQVGPDQRRTSRPATRPGGAKSEENGGAKSG